MAKKAKPSILVVSDGRGDTGTQVVQAAVVQFEGQPYRLVRKGNVRTPKAIADIVRHAARSGSIIVYTLVAEETRRALQEEAAAQLVPTVDVLGPMVSALHDLFKAEPRSKPGLLYASDRERFDRMEAIDYTLKHDDGQRIHELDQADVVVVGVSRASKSSTCFYLAYEGVRAANVPIVPGVAPSQTLLDLDPQKVIGLRVNLMRLITVREARALSMGISIEHDYLDKREVARELRTANGLMEQRGWRSFDVSYLAVEEIAREVLRLIGLR